MDKIIVTWDLGATKCAAAVVLYNERTHEIKCSKVCKVKLRSVSSLKELIFAIENSLNIRHQDSDYICIGAAGIFDGECLHLANGYPFAMPITSLAKTFFWPRFYVVHDYTSMICATFYSTIKSKKLNNCEGDMFGRRVAFGIGTGLGLKDGVLFANGDFWLGANEMGHIGISNPIDAPKHVLDIHRELTHKNLFTFEKILSGNGLLRLHHFLYPTSEIKTPKMLGELISAGKFKDTLSLFSFYLGLFTATVQLSFMPSGGIWISGGVVKKHQNLFDCKEFLEGLYSLPAYLKERDNFPLRILYDEYAAFIGAAYYTCIRRNSGKAPLIPL